MEPHKEILADMIPPRKHLLKHQPVSTQIALMDGNTFCTSLTPRLFSINLSVPEHLVFFQEVSVCVCGGGGGGGGVCVCVCGKVLISALTTSPPSPQLVNLCDSDDSTLSKLPCYRSVPSLVPLKVTDHLALSISLPAVAVPGYMYIVQWTLCQLCLSNLSILRPNTVLHVLCVCCIDSVHNVRSCPLYTIIWYLGEWSGSTGSLPLPA